MVFQMSNDLTPPYGTDWAEEMIPETWDHLTAREKQLREDFVRELMVDHDYVKAAVRIGFGELAKQYGTRFKFDKYVSLRYEQAMSAELHAPEVEDDQRRKVINMLFREAEYTGPGASHSARVTAQAKLAALLGLEKPKKSEQTIEHKGGVDDTVTHSMDFDNMDGESLKLMRQLLTIQSDKEDEQKEAAIHAKQ